MSAFMVDDITINKVLAWIRYDRHGKWISRMLAKDLGTEVKGHAALESLGHRLFRMNILAISQRYGEGEAEKFRPLDYKYESVLPSTKIQTYKSLQCLMYQCAEGIVPETNLYKAMDNFQNRLARDIVSDLDSYKAADWR